MSASANSQPQAAPEARVAKLLAGLWQRNQVQVGERLALLESAAAELKAGSLSPARREQAIATAHNLAGTLGMFGFPRGTEIARTLEQAFDSDRADAQRCVTEVAALRKTLFPPSA